MVKLFDFQFFLSTFPDLARVIPVTLKITIVAMLASLVTGLIVALVRSYKVPGLRQLAAVYVSFARGTPMLVQIYLSYYGIPLVVQFLRDKYGWNLDVSQIPAIVFIYFAFTFNVAAYLSETIRAAILAIDKGQMEAALSVGMSSLQGLRRIVLPQALAVALPSFGNTRWPSPTRWPTTSRSLTAAWSWRRARRPRCSSRLANSEPGCSCSGCGAIRR